MYVIKEKKIERQLHEIKEERIEIEIHRERRLR